MLGIASWSMVRSWGTANCCKCARLAQLSVDLMLCQCFYLDRTVRFTQSALNSTQLWYLSWRNSLRLRTSRLVDGPSWLKTWDRHSCERNRTNKEASFCCIRTLTSGLAQTYPACDLSVLVQKLLGLHLQRFLFWLEYNTLKDRGRAENC